MKRPRGPNPSLAAVRRAYNERYVRAPLGDSPRYYRWLTRRALAHLEPGRRADAHVLDAGCGQGELARAMLATAGGDLRSMVALDLSDAALAFVRRAAPEARRVLGQGERLPFASASFDIVLCSGNLEHFLDPERGARELARVCRADGTVWILLPNSYYSGSIWRVWRTGYGPNHHQIVDRFATIHEWRDLLEANGLAVDEILPYNRFKWWKRLLPRNFAYHFLYRARPART